MVALLNSGSSFAGLSGQFDSIVQVDNRYFDDRVLIEEWGNMQFASEDGKLKSGMTFALRKENGIADGGSDGQVYQLYVDQRFSTKNNIKLGRFHKSDSLGFYSLDGVSLRLRQASLVYDLYAGVPHQIEDYASLSADVLYGADLFYNHDGNYKLNKQWQVEKSTLRFGWQHYKNDQINNRLSWSGSVNAVNSGRGLSDLSVTFSGVYSANENHFEEMNATAVGNYGDRARLRLSYETYEPTKPYLTFRERFYSLYARGQQRQFKSSAHLQRVKGEEWFVAARKVSREFGDTGYGGSAGLSYRNIPGVKIETQIDLLQLDESRNVSLFVSAEKSLSLRQYVAFNAALQKQNKSRLGENSATALEASLEHMVDGNTYLTAVASYIHNSQLDNEYRLSLNWSYRFDSRPRGGAL